MTPTEFSASASLALIRTLTSHAETRHLEFKRVSGKMVGKALETLCAFANTDGGTLVLGMADLKEFQGTARIFGVEENPEAVDELQRKLLTEFVPDLGNVRLMRLSCSLHNGAAKGKAGHLLLINVERSARVHSIVNSGTYVRLDASNRSMSAGEITELSYRRGERSASSEPVPISLERLQTSAWARFAEARGPLTGSFASQLLRIGLAEEVDGVVRPRRAAVLLFADEPGSLLAAHDTRADVRVMVYDGKQLSSAATPNLRKVAKTVRGPLIDQIDGTVRLVLDELAQGLTVSHSGFRTLHAYPERVIKEAIVNAVIHRDYRLNRDIFVRIFDDRVEVESPGLLPGSITPSNIAKTGSKARNPLIASNLREFPVAPNIDAGEDVRMMFAEMAQAELYPPQYRQNTESAVESVTVTLFNSKRPSAWDEVSDWIDRNGSIANGDVVRIARVDTLKASKLLISWREQGLLVSLPGRAKRNMAYTKPNGADAELSLLSALEDNNAGRK
ncbi:ATP-binding protein [Roseateles toxinivorans]|uniref:ATP-dependent DNA helicase RecG n=1 Tax=Roseateles toxinivorans TaxID=270368 RepID=A0A4R6QPE7_9BURK|nr:ATP-binding protein [Roseateles toxinivorans]TDP72507.1 ATP-dependent DNA helicase RecG [Roseateles toxinivorans]